jgi:superfamily II DNA helicase RecQ
MAYGAAGRGAAARMIDESEADEEFKRAERQPARRLLGLCEATTCRRQHCSPTSARTAPDRSNCDAPAATATTASACSQRPLDEATFGTLSGVGVRKREKYAAAFLAVIRAHA